MDHVGIRELRNQVAAIVRRAGSGEQIVITVDGEPVARLGPLVATGTPTLDDLAASGQIRLPHRRDHPDAPHPVAVPVDVRADDVLAQLRGEDPGTRR